MEYAYVAYDQEQRLVRGTQTAASEDVADKLLSGRGYRVLTLKPLSTFLPRFSSLNTSISGVRPETVIMFSRQLALLLESGVDLVNALELLKMQSSKVRFRQILTDMIADLRRGERLSQALSHHPRVFSKVYVQSISAGERVGSVETMLRQMAEYQEKELRASKNIKSALQYPIIVSVVAVIVIGVLAVFVLPAFVNLYQQLGAKLPALTRMVLTAMRVVSQYAPAGLVVVIGGGVGLFIVSRTPAGKETTDRLALRLPLLGKVVHLNELVRCCRGMAILHKSGLPVPEIMGMIVETSNNAVVKKALVQVQQDVLKGEGLSGPMAKDPVFMPLMVQMIGVGESTGSLDSSLTATAANYESEAEERMRSVVSLIQPTVTVALGLVVGLVALSLVSAMYSVYGQ